jgi:hypothetical protein
VGEARTGPRNVGLKRQPAMDADKGSPRRGLASPVDMLLRGFETTVYAIGFLLLAAAAVLVNAARGGGCASNDCLQCSVGAT